MTPETSTALTKQDVGPSCERSLCATQSVLDQLAVLRGSLSRRLLRRGMGHTAFKSSPLGDIPVSWDVRSLGEIASLTSGKAKPRDWSYLMSLSRPVPIYGGNGLLGFTSNHLRTGKTIVIGRIGARCGAVHFVPDEISWITDNALFTYETRPGLELRFLYYSLCHLDLASVRSKGRQPVISLGTIYPLLLAVPPIAEQREISEVLTSLDTLMHANAKVLEQSKKMRSALLAATLPGCPPQ